MADTKDKDYGMGFNSNQPKTIEKSEPAITQFRLPSHSQLSMDLLTKIDESIFNDASFDAPEKLGIETIQRMIYDMAQLFTMTKSIIANFYNPFALLGYVYPMIDSAKNLFYLFKDDFDKLWNEINDIKENEAKKLLILLIDSIKQAFK